jgi:hypothetical protein
LSAPTRNHGAALRFLANAQAGVLPLFLQFWVALLEPFGMIHKAIFAGWSAFISQRAIKLMHSRAYAALQQ